MVDQIVIDRDQLKGLVREMVEEVIDELLWKIEQKLPDPDEGLTFRPEVAEHLRQATRDQKRGTPLTDIMRDMGLDE
jgi:hypothetical protein